MKWISAHGASLGRDILAQEAFVAEGHGSPAPGRLCSGVCDEEEGAHGQELANVAIWDE